MIRVMSMTTAKLIDAIGQDTLLAELSVTERALRHARYANAFAASWYLPIKTVAERHGVHCPDELFNWKPLLRHGDANAADQGDAS